MIVAVLDDLSHHAADARKRADREEETQLYFLFSGHLHLIQNDQRHRQEGEVEGAVNDGKAVSQLVPVETLASFWMAAPGDQAEFQLGGTCALEEFHEQGESHVNHNEDQEAIVGEHPSA